MPATALRSEQTFGGGTPTATAAKRPYRAHSRREVREVRHRGPRRSVLHNLSDGRVRIRRSSWLRPREFHLLCDPHLDELYAPIRGIGIFAPLDLMFTMRPAGLCLLLSVPKRRAKAWITTSGEIMLTSNCRLYSLGRR